MSADKILGPWNCFWFGKISTKKISIFRIAFAFVLLLALLHYPGIADLHFKSLKIATSSQSYNPHPYMYPFLEFLPVASFQVYNYLQYSSIILALFVLVGLFSRIAGLVLLFILSYRFFISQLHYSHNGFLLILVLLLLCFMKTSECYSIDSLLRKKKPIAFAEIWPIRLLQVLVSIIYVFSVINKLHAGWLDGTLMWAVYYAHRMDGFMADLTTSMLSFKLFSLLIIGIQTYVVFALWYPRLRMSAIFLGVFMHVGMELTMGVGVYNFLMIILLMLYISPQNTQEQKISKNKSDKTQFLMAGFKKRQYETRKKKTASFP